MVEKRPTFLHELFTVLDNGKLVHGFCYQVDSVSLIVHTDHERAILLLKLHRHPGSTTLEYTHTIGTEAQEHTL